jgi:predicted metal-dependent peptidase
MAKSKTKKKEELDVADLKERARNVLAFVRTNVLQRHPFIGNVGMNLNLIPVRDFRCDTAMTDGNNIFFDIDFLSSLTSDEREFVLAHEIWHCVMMHFARRGTRIPMIFNLATDMEVNQLLESDGFIAPKNLVWPNDKNRHKSMFDLPDGLSAEEYYELLLKKMKSQQMKGGGESGEGGNGESGEGNGSGSSSGSKSKADKLNGQFDKHYDKHKNYKKEGEDYKGGSKDKYGEKGIDEDFRPAAPEDEERNANNIREAVVGAVQQIERSRGTVPAFIKSLVDKILKPEINWREQLAADITTTMQNKTNWNRPNRRFVYSGTYLPSHAGEAINIAVGIDTSGSCANDCKKFLSEVVSIAKTFGDYHITLIQCDTEVKDVTEYDEANPLDPEGSPVEFKGFGGTVLMPIFDYIRDNDVDADKIIMFTDGYTEDFNETDAPSLPVLWVITKDGVSDHIHFGNVIQLKDEPVEE